LEDYATSIFRVDRIRKLGTLSVTNRLNHSVKKHNHRKEGKGLGYMRDEWRKGEWELDYVEVSQPGKRLPE
jgi:hypothetical protein